MGRLRRTQDRERIVTVPDFADVYRAHFDFAWRSARRLGVPDHALDDAVQETFLIVHRKLVDFEGRSSLKTWIFGILRRVVRDHRAPPRGQLAPAETLDQIAAPGEDGPLRSAATAEAGRRLARLLDKLDDQKREVFVMAELEGLTAPEIASLLELNTNTVYSRLRLARRAFEAALEAHERSSGP